MINAPKTTLFNNLDDLDLEFYEGENSIEFEIDDYSFIVTYSLEKGDTYADEDYNEYEGGLSLKVISINAYDNIEEEDFNVNIDDDIQKLFSDYYYRSVDGLTNFNENDFFGD